MVSVKARSEIKQAISELAAAYEDLNVQTYHNEQGIVLFLGHDSEDALDGKTIDRLIEGHKIGKEIGLSFCRQVALYTQAQGIVDQVIYTGYSALINVNHYINYFVPNEEYDPIFVAVDFTASSYLDLGQGNFHILAISDCSLESVMKRVEKFYKGEFHVL